MAEDCGEEAAEFVAKFTRRAAGALIHVTSSISSLLS